MVIAGSAVWCLIQVAHPVFRVAEKYHVPSIGMPQELFAEHDRQQDLVDRKHAMLYLGVLGLLVAAVLGIREGGCAAPGPPLLVALPLGAVGGAAGGMLGCLMYEYVHAHVGQAQLTHVIERNCSWVGRWGF